MLTASPAVRASEENQTEDEQGQADNPGTGPGRRQAGQVADDGHAREDPVTVPDDGVDCDGPGEDQQHVTDRGPTELGGNPPSRHMTC